MFVILVVTAAVIVYMQWEWKKGNESLAATDAWCDASEAFCDWRMENPGVYIGLSPEGRMLLARNIEGYDWFLKTHPWIDGTEHRAWLVSLFDDLPPKYPRDAKPTFPSRSSQGLFFSCINKGTRVE